MANLHETSIANHAPLPAVICSINAGKIGKVKAGNVLDNFGKLWII